MIRKKTRRPMTAKEVVEKYSHLIYDIDNKMSIADLCEKHQISNFTVHRIKTCLREVRTAQTNNQTPTTGNKKVERKKKPAPIKNEFHRVIEFNYVRKEFGNIEVMSTQKILEYNSCKLQWKVVPHDWKLRKRFPNGDRFFETLKKLGFMLMILLFFVPVFSQNEADVYTEVHYTAYKDLSAAYVRPYLDDIAVTGEYSQVIHLPGENENALTYGAIFALDTKQYPYKVTLQAKSTQTFSYLKADILWVVNSSKDPTKYVLWKEDGTKLLVVTKQGDYFLYIGDKPVFIKFNRKP